MTTQDIILWDEEQLLYMMPPSPPDLTEIYDPYDSEDEYTPVTWTEEDLHDFAVYVSNHQHIEGIWTTKPNLVLDKVE